MGALDKLKNLFGEDSKKAKAKPQLKAVKPEMKADNKGQQGKTNRDKAEVEILQKKIQEKLRKDPELQKKAAMILENMINGKPKK